MSNSILVSAYFDDRRQDAKLAYFEALDRAVRKAGLKIHLLNLNSRRIETSCEGEPLPFLISKAHWLPISGVVGPLDANPAVRHAASIDALCWGRSLRAESFRVVLFREHLRRLIARVRPSLYIAWHEFFSFHYSLPAMLREEFPGLPFLFTEFGPLPGTITFDEDGQMGESDVAQRPGDFAALPVNADDLRRAAEFIERVRVEKRSRKPQTASADPFGPLETRLAGAKGVVFYAGQYDFRTGMVPRSLPQSGVHSPWFADTFDALAHLNDVALRNGWVVLFKPHPLDTGFRERMAPLGELEAVALVSGVSIFECFERADAVVTIVSQVNYMALIHGKPCVTLGRTYLWDKGCDYQPKGRADVEPSIRAAIEDGITETQRAALQRHVAQLMRYRVFQFDEDFTIDGLRNLDATAKFLIKRCAASAEPGADHPTSSTRDLGSGAARNALFRATYGIVSRV